MSSEAVSGTAFPAGSAWGAESHSYPRQDTVRHTFSTHQLPLESCLSRAREQIFSLRTARRCSARCAPVTVTLCVTAARACVPCVSWKLV